MLFWQEGLLLLGVLWACQVAGTWMQMRHYRSVMRQITQTWPDGCVGASAARGTFGKGVIAIIVTGPDAVVRQAFLMEGRSVFAKFQEFPAAQGHSLSAMPAELGAGHPGRQRAVAGAIAQIRSTLERRVPAEATALAA